MNTNVLKLIIFGHEKIICLLGNGLNKAIHGMHAINLLVSVFIVTAYKKREARTKWQS